MNETTSPDGASSSASPPPDREFVVRQRRMRKAARTSWKSFVVVMVVVFITRMIKWIQGHEIPGTLDQIVSIFLGSTIMIGVVSGFVALVNVRRYGRKQILWPALAGLTLWGMVFAGSIYMFVTLAEIAAHHEPTVMVAATYFADATRVGDESLGFSFDLPDDMQPVDPAKLTQGCRYAFLRRYDREVAGILTITPLDGPIPRRKPDAQSAPGIDLTAITNFNWRGLEIYGFRVQEKLGEVDFVNFNVVVPLRKQAVQFGFGAPVDAEEELRKMIDQVLASLDGETNWWVQPAVCFLGGGLGGMVASGGEQAVLAAFPELVEGVRFAVVVSG